MAKKARSSTKAAPARRKGRVSAAVKNKSLATPVGKGIGSGEEIAETVNGLVADAFTLYIKTKNFHWHLSGPQFRDYHLLFDEQASQIFASIDPLAERVRKLGKRTLRSIGDIQALRSLDENEASFVRPGDMLTELMDDNRQVVEAMRKAHQLCEDNHDAGTASLLEQYIDEGEKRIWFLFESRQ